MDFIYDIRSMLNLSGRMTIIFNPRSSNCFADALAKKGSNSEGDFVLWDVD